MKIRLAALALMAILMVRPALAADQVNSARLIFEAEVRAVSAALYTELARQAVNKGWRFTPQQMEHGYKRHPEELKLRLIDKGYVIVAGDVGV